LETAGFNSIQLTNTGGDINITTGRPGPAIFLSGVGNANELSLTGAIAGQQLIFDLTNAFALTNGGDSFTIDADGNLAISTPDGFFIHMTPDNNDFSIGCTGIGVIDFDRTDGFLAIGGAATLFSTIVFGTAGNILIESGFGQSGGFDCNMGGGASFEVSDFQVSTGPFPHVGMIHATSASELGFYATGFATPVTQQTVTGATAANVALQNLLTALANLGLIVNSTT
jgi:hypothetical protein